MPINGSYFDNYLFINQFNVISLQNGYFYDYKE